MNDSEIDRLLGLTQPTPLAAPALAKAGQELREEIMSTAPRSETQGTSDEDVSLIPQPRKPEPRWSTGRRLLVATAAGLAVVAAIVVPMASLRGGEAVTPASVPSSTTTPEPSSSPTPAIDPALLATTTNPWVLLDAPGWEIDYLNEENWGEGIYGEIEYVDAEASLELYWNSDQDYQDDLHDRTEEFGQPLGITLFGKKAKLFDMANGEFEVLMRRGAAYLKIRGNGAPDLAIFQQWLGQLRQVTPTQWYATLPTSVVVPYRSAEVAAQILEDIPVPDDFDTSVLASNLTATYDAFGAKVTGQVTCAWLKDYSAARESDDKAGMARVDQVLSGARDWKFLRSMDEEDGWDDMIVEYAARVAEREPVVNSVQELGCRA